MSWGNNKGLAESIANLHALHRETAASATRAAARASPVPGGAAAALVVSEIGEHWSPNTAPPRTTTSPRPRWP